MKTTPSPPERGMILLNVLTVVAVSSAVVVLMTATQDLGLQRSQRLREAAEVAAVARAGELSARVALRRDAIEAPASDHLREAWAGVAQDEVAIRGGRFSLEVADAQARFNVNGLVAGGLTAEATLRKVVAAAGEPPAVADRIAGLIRAAGPVADLSALASAGIDPDAVAALDPLATALPGATPVNINTADERLIAALLDNSVAARRLAARRESTGFLTDEDVKSARVLLPPGVGYTSDHFQVRTVVSIGDTRQGLVSVLQRRRRGDRVEVVTISRQREAAARTPDGSGSGRSGP